MAPIEPSSRYAASVRRMHWTIFALVLLAYVFINLFELFPKGSATRGNVLASDWERGRYHHHDTRTMVPLPARVRCYAIAGALRTGPAGSALGDGLVAVDSALGRHARPTRDLRLPVARTWVATGVSHLGLLGDRGVYAKLRDWLR